MLTQLLLYTSGLSYASFTLGSLYASNKLDQEKQDFYKLKRTYETITKLNQEGADLLNDQNIGIVRKLTDYRSEILQLNEEINSLIEQRKILESEKAYLLKENNVLKEKLNCEK